MGGLLLHDSPWVVCSRDQWVRNGAVYIEDGRVAEVGESTAVAAKYPDAERIDCSGIMLVPGMINGHNHVYEILCRGLGRDAGTEAWLHDLIYPMTRRLEDEDYYYGALLGAADAFRTGTTSLVSQMTNFARFHVDAEAQAYADAGIRARVARASSTASTIDPQENAAPADELRETAAFLDRWSQSDLVRGQVGPSGLFSCDPDTLRQLKELARGRGSKFFIHLAETRVQLDLAHARGYPGQIEWAYRIGILDPDTVVAHAVWISDAEIAILRDTGATVVHNPISNMIMSSGVANVPRMLAEGVNVTIGTDGPASNDAQDMIAEMKAAVLLHRVATLDPTIIDARTVFAMATDAGARIFGGEGRLGVIAPGYDADVVGVRIADNPSLLPVFDPVASLVYCGSGRDVCLTLVRGQVVYRDGVYPTIDVPAVVEQIERVTVPRVRDALGVGTLV